MAAAMTYPACLRLPFPTLAAAPLLLAAPPPGRAALPLPDPDDGGLTLPPGFRALVFADQVTATAPAEQRHDALRFLTVAPNGDIYINSDQDIASVLNYVRANFAPEAPRVTAQDVSAQRGK